MNLLEIKLENCHGIGKLHHTFEYEAIKTNSFLIYAPNGSMKTSFARTLEQISKNDSKSMPCDKVYPDRPTYYSVLADGIPIDNDMILVVNSEDSSYDSSGKISSFIASKDLKKRYDEIYSELIFHQKEYIKKLKQVSQSTDCEEEFIKTYSTSLKDTFFELLLVISKSLTTSPVTHSFRYNDIFDKKGQVQKFLEKNQKFLGDYIKNYEELLKNSKFFNKSINTFGTYQANELIKSTEDNSYFEAGHKLTLNDDTEVKSSEELKSLLLAEIGSIVNDEKLKKIFDQVDKAIGANTELRSFKNAIEQDNLLLIDLEKYEDFRKKVWLNYISALSKETEELVLLYKEKKIELETIINEAKKESETWKEIIQTFNERFYVPFTVKLVNLEDVILKEETANLKFEFNDLHNNPVIQDRNNLLSILSKGEQRAFYILQFLFDIEARKKSDKESLLILDDIADSFDYKNKYAIIQYLKELNDSQEFKLIILTHNFDFYRTVASRLSIRWEAAFMIIKNERREIAFHQGQYRKDVFNYIKKNISDSKNFTSIIPFTRNLIEYADSGSPNYELLTACLHIKPTTNTITCGKILDLIHSITPSTVSQTISFSNKNIKEVIFETADNILSEISLDEILLQNKIVLSIAIRLKAEEFMFSQIPNSSELVISSNQTSELFEKYKELHPGFSDAKRILEKVNLMTPENIHVNAFMYEPLIDMSVLHLIDLYQEVKDLATRTQLDLINAI